MALCCVRTERRAGEDSCDSKPGRIAKRTKPGLETYVGLAHALNLPVLNQLRELILAVPDRNIHIQVTSIVGPVIGTYVGPGAVAFCFIQE